MSMQKLKSLIGDIKIAMFTTVDRYGHLRSRPLSTMQDDSDDLYFFTRDDAPKVDEIAKDSCVCLAYAHPGNNSFVSVCGSAELVRDRAEVNRFWQPIHLAWFPDGPEDPELALLKVKVHEAEYWDAPSSKVVILFGMAKAVLTGEAYRPGDNEKLKAA